jgi:hypothetical protein
VGYYWSRAEIAENYLHDAVTFIFKLNLISREEMHDPKRVRDFADQDDDVEEEEELMDSLGRENMDVLVDEDE